jgi:hypothetical protein
VEVQLLAKGVRNLMLVGGWVGSSWWGKFLILNFISLKKTVYNAEFEVVQLGTTVVIFLYTNKNNQS